MAAKSQAKFKLGFLGCGQMGEAILKGLFAAGTLKPAQVAVSDPRRAETLHKTYRVTALKAEELLPRAETLLVAIKPQVAREAQEALRRWSPAGQLVVSVVAGIEAAFWEAGRPQPAPVVRAMPNTPALVGAGFTGLARGGQASDRDFQRAAEIFQAVGEVAEIPENLFHALSALSGCGPAYMFSFLEALTEAGIMLGLTRDLAQKAASQTMLGAAHLAQVEFRKNEEEPGRGRPLAELRQMVTSPGGLTAQALYVLEQGAFRGTVMAAVAAAEEKSREVAEKAGA